MPHEKSPTFVNIEILKQTIQLNWRIDFEKRN